MGDMKMSSCNDRNYARVFISEKTYYRIIRSGGDVAYSVTQKNGVNRRLTSAKTLAAIDAVIIDAAHEEALAMNEAFDWANITPAQRQLHDARVGYGLELRGKHNTDSVLEACHAEALEMNAQYDDTAYVARLDQRLGDPITEGMQWQWDNTYCDEYKSARLNLAHAEAIKANEALDDTCLILSEPCMRDLWPAQDQHMLSLIINAAHAEALEMNAEFDRRRALNVERTLQNEMEEARK